MRGKTSGKAIGVLVLALTGTAFGQFFPGGGAVVGTNPVVSTLTTGNVLDATATVSDDRRYVIMKVNPAFSQLDGLDTFATPAFLNNGFNGGGFGGGNGGGGVGINGGNGGNGVGAPGLNIAGGGNFGNGGRFGFGINAGQAAGRGAMAGSTMVTGMVGAPMYMAVTQQQNFVSNFRQAVMGNVTFVENDKTLLASEVAPMTMKDTSLKQAMRTLADKTNKNVVLGNRAFEQAGVDIAKPHTFVLGSEQGTMKLALVAILKEVAPDVDLVVTADDNVVQVTTQAAADNQMVTKLYYLEDLMARLPRIISSKTDLRTLKEDDATAKAAKNRAADGSLGSLAVTGSSMLLPAGVETQKISTPAKPEAAPAKVNREVPMNLTKPYATDIVELITSTVRPEIWKNHGGKYAEVTVSGNRVMVRAPASVHAILDGPKVYDPNAVPKYTTYGTRGGGGLGL